MQFESSIRGHHIYKNVWTPSIGESLSLALESVNSHDRFAVSLVKDERVVGHVPREVTRIFFYLMQRHETISVEVTGHRRYGMCLMKYD